MQKIKIAWLKYICIYFIVLCGPGTYSSSGQIPCKKCPRGKYQTDYGRTRCEDCGVGLSTIQDGAMAFRDCSTKGWHLFFEINSNAFGMRVLFNLTWYLLFPVTCAAGNFFDVLKHQCLPCPVGTYQPTTGLNFCYACPVSTSTDFVGSTNQSDCKSELYYQRCIFFICLKFSPHTDCYRTFWRTNYCSILPLLANVSSFYTIYIKYLVNLNLFTLTS